MSVMEEGLSNRRYRMAQRPLWFEPLITHGTDVRRAWYLERDEQVLRSFDHVIALLAGQVHNFFYKAAWYAWYTALALHLCALLGWIVPRAVIPTMWVMMSVTLVIAAAGIVHIAQFREALMEGADPSEDIPVRNMFKGVPSWTVWLALSGFIFPFVSVSLSLATGGLPNGTVVDHGTFFTLVTTDSEPVIIDEETFGKHQAGQLAAFSAAWVGFLSMAIWMLYPHRVMKRNGAMGYR